jgi:DHA2 family lincomycin resistance protein-like MFS transporter
MTLLGTQSRWEFIMAGHIVMCVGFALLFTPLFTVCLSSVPPQLYSHGSAVLGSLQQVGGAAGVALFIAIMSAETAELAAAGTTEIEALAAGIRAAFLVGAIGALLAVASTFFVRKPEAAAPPGAH